METYLIKLRHHGRTIILAVFFFLAFLFIAISFFPVWELDFRFAITLLLTILAYISDRKFTIAKTIWILNDEGIIIEWKEHYFGITNSDITIRWDEMVKYKDVYGRGYNLFKIFLVDGRILEFGHGFSGDFSKMYEQFQKSFMKTKNPEAWQKYYGKKYSK